MSAIEVANSGTSVAQSWMCALQLSASAQANRNRILPAMIEEMSARLGDAPALMSDRECFTYGELGARLRQYARWALTKGITKGDVVGLLMSNRPEYFAVWLGITSVGGVVALLNSNLIGSSLSHCINAVNPSHLIVDSGLVDSLAGALPDLAGSPAVWVHGTDAPGFGRIDQELQRLRCTELSEGEKPVLTLEDRALYIFTSGTTGLPKAAKVSHARILQWSHWFAGMMNVQPEDRMYSCLPMYHSIGGVLVPGAMLVGGGSVVIRERFSASQFWNDILRWDCTIFQYIGEFCRYLLHAAPPADASGHRVRLACGNGLAADVWSKFEERFQIPRILEFYASTEGAVSLFNVEGKCGSIGRVPPYLTHRFSPALVRFDIEKGESIRDEHGFCIRCTVNEIGEALGRIRDNSDAGTRFEGYTDKRATEDKVLRNVFEAGDAWVRTGDLMRKDENGFFFFVDRIGDTFRWKGENVATSEVAEVICGFPGVTHAAVYGVAIPGTEGKAGMAALVADREIEFSAFRQHLASRLPTYARPLFLRVRDEIQTTGTFKYSKSDLVHQSYDPTSTRDAIYFHDPERKEFRPLDVELYARIQSGQIRL
jgi:fatty-acyl-CoA synthase